MRLVWLGLFATAGNHAMTANALSLHMSNQPPPKPPPTSNSLSQVYKSIGNKAVERAGNQEWPDSTDANRLFATDINPASGDSPDHQRAHRFSYVLPSFPKGDGPLAVAALLDATGGRNAGSGPIIRESVDVFEAFVRDLQEILATGAADMVKELLEQNIWRVPLGTHHITVAVFQEHPSLFWNEQDKKRCSLVQENEAERIRQSLSSYFLESSSPRHAPPKLKLDSLLLTDTGAMIAGFIDDTDPFFATHAGDSATFQAIRVACSQIAISVIGEDRLTSRPKNLIHTTVGRVLALPSPLTSAQKQAVAELIKFYNKQVLPKVVKKLHHGGQDSFALTELTMLREIVWTLQDFKEYQTWHLMPTAGLIE
ncbi:expressed unknown protein [Seminavis robusta]|uniref:Uncharacterized protein n=1 Tax=Seminavis robusta TaxID=568900 RepID=A0A9N8ELN6_9STRA|nr:expressed unknown protein [Seminavis robusta]|eukprot:Sro1491_g277110.1 n/a (369) ;mRNA; r:13439-14545